jgi:lipopolysaccharide/colanic/teichoic acid biosynthesis glycosyltransferase
VAKRALDLAVALSGLLLLSPLLVVVSVLVFVQDWRSPFYVAPRVGRDGRLFRMFKFRTMVVGADRSGVTSTSSRDARITPLGQFLRRSKFDELPQLWNVLLGELSLVGPRPNVPAGVAVYTDAERRLLSVRPGITDLASIVFADEGEILSGHADPDKAYDQLIRPWKSRLGLFYVERRSLWLDLRLIGLTLLAVVARPRALNAVARILTNSGASPELIAVAGRTVSLEPGLPPGAVPSVY